MSMTTVSLAQDRTFSIARVGDYISLCKPRIAVLVLIAVAVANCVATWGQPHPIQLLNVLFGTLLIASSASTLNQWIERRLDCLMVRTKNRALPSGRLSATSVLVFGLGLVLAGESYLLWSVGVWPAFWGLLTWFLYVWVYTPAKTRTSTNTAIGAVAGAMPIMIGWSAGGPLDIRTAAIFLLMFLWQFPHFMAIAWLYREDYARAGMKMLPVVEPTGARAGVQAVWAALAMVPVSVVPALFAPGVGAMAYGIVALLLGLGQLFLAVQFCAWRTESSARNLLRASLIYLPTVLLLLMFVPWV